MSEIVLCDRATGVKGSYCIGRKTVLDYMQYWNPSGWAGFGYCFTDKKLALAIIDLLKKVDK